MDIAGKLIVMIGMAAAANAVLYAEMMDPIPATLFGQNLEHTRSSITGGLSAELVRNRKFAGKPSREGLAREWESFGCRAFYDHMLGCGVGRHLQERPMPRRNEIASQKITTLADGGLAGIRQRNLALRKGVGYDFTARVRSAFEEDSVNWSVRVVRADGTVVAERDFVTKGKAWSEIAFGFESAADDDVALEIGVRGRMSGLVGAVSLMPRDSLRGMRRDVIAKMREIGTSIVRWPGGNFAGEYRWRDCQLPRDERAPLQSALESETQAYTGGFDVNDIGTDDILALCDELGAEPYFTINAAWELPEDSADWVRYCGGRVRHWSLGNEFGHPHMEGPKTPEEYTALARRHAAAMLEADPQLKLCASGHYPDTFRPWIEKSAIPLADIVREISVHCYTWPKTFDYSSPERIEASYRSTLEVSDGCFDRLHEMRALMPKGLSMSFDEWNFWYAWFRDDDAIQGVYAMHFLHRLMREYKELGVSCCCFFQAINEGAIRVYPRSVRLTSTGEALRLAKSHIGGVPVGDLPREVFGTVHQTGEHRFTVYNPSALKSLRVRLPVGAVMKLAASEILGTDDPYAGTRYQPVNLAPVREEGAYTLDLPPRAIGLVVFGK